MFKMLADTSTQDLFIALIKDGECIDYVFKKDLLKKADVLPIYFKQLLVNNKLLTKDITEFYCTNGPGSFTGSRSAFIFFKTICMIGKGKLYISSSLQFLARVNQNNNIIADARSQMQYVGSYKNKKLINKIELIKGCQAISTFNLDDFLNNTLNYLEGFQAINDILSTKVNYIKSPAIGEVKK